MNTLTRRSAAIWIIAQRDLVTRARSKTFRISSALLLLGMILGIAIPSMLNRNATHHSYTVAVVATQSSDLPAAIGARAQAAGVTVATRAVADRTTAVGLVESSSVDAAVVTEGGGELIWKNNADDRLNTVLREALTQTAIVQRAQQLGLSTTQLGSLLAPAAPASTTLQPEPERTAQTIIATVGMVLLFVALNFYGSLLLTGVVEEKSSRVVEVLLARVDAATLLAGKVLGIGLLGIGQFGALALAAAATLRITHPAGLPSASTSQIAGVLLWFVLGYCFYSVLYASFGALASRTEDAQAVSAPLTVGLLLVYFAAFAALRSPSSWWVATASFLPPTAPIFMPIRSALTDVPAWQAVTAVVVMIASIPAVIALAGRLYRGGLLHTTGRAGLRQAWQWSARMDGR